MDKSEINYIAVTIKEEGLAKLEALGQKKSFPSDYVIARAGNEVDCCYLIKKGRVAVCEYFETGERRIYMYSEANSMILEEPLLQEQKSMVEYITIRPTEVIQISKEVFLKVALQDVDVANAILRTMAEKLQNAGQQLRYGMNRNAAWKICSLFLFMEERFGVPKDGMIIIKEKISQKEISDLLGMNRITVTREIKKLKDMKLVDKKDYYYRILDKQGLEEYLESQPKK